MNPCKLFGLLLWGLLPTLVWAQVRELPSPAGPGSGQPNLTVSRTGRFYLSWIEKLAAGRYALRFAVRWAIQTVRHDP